ncbi:MAG: hypothetical protein ACYSR6_03930 [Planctomycetota bacterium]|jgi:hypothetical protein
MISIRGIRYFIAGLVFGSLCPVTAFGAGPVDVDDHNLYIGIGPSYHMESFAREEGQVSIENAIGIHGSLGFRVHRFIAFEFRYDYSGWFENHWVYDPYSAANSFFTRYYLTTANIRGMFKAGRWEPSMVLGVGLARSQLKIWDKTYEDDVDLVFRTGASLAHRFKESFGIETSVVSIVLWDKDPSIDFYSLNIGAVFWLGPQVK